MAKQGAQSRFRDMGFTTASEAYSTMFQQVVLELGIEATRGMERMRINKLGIALAGNVSSRMKAKRQSAARDQYYNQADGYASRHCYYDV